jgi:hypothetical protein
MSEQPFKMVPALANCLPGIIVDLVEWGIPVEIEPEGFRIGGFYKHGRVLLCKRGDDRKQNESEWFIRDRYDKVHDIDTFDDIVSLNNELLWDDYQPGDWAECLVAHGYLKRVVTETYRRI